MREDVDLAKDLAEQVRAARGPLAIVGSGSKRFYSGTVHGTMLDVTGHRGIVEYEPTELVITARAGTSLKDIERALAEKGQMLAFEPPHFGDGATLGGTIACGFSGPRRPFAGSARDFVLGTRIVNGKGEVLCFGGKVMKNVAGYDISRLMAGSLGTLGVILDLSLKVLPCPAAETTLGFEESAANAIAKMNRWAGQPLPLSAAAHIGETMYVRLSGAESAVGAARKRLGGEVVENGELFWEEVREHRQIFFQGSEPLWRLSVPPATATLDLPGNWLIDWGGAQRWLVSGAPEANIRSVAAKAGGYAKVFRNSPLACDSLTQLDPIARALQARIRQAFDPNGVFGGTGAAVAA
jgi:glycolate oxidase FAD binding subunit